MQNPLSAERGFTLIEALIAIAVLSIGAVGIASMMSSQAQMTTYLNDRLSYIDRKSVV